MPNDIKDSRGPAPTPGQAARFLGQASFGATPADVAEVCRIGYAAWIDRQLAMPVSQRHFDWLMAQGLGVEAHKGNGINAPLDGTLWRKIISAPDQLRVKAAFALSQIFVVNVTAITASWPMFGAAAFMDLLGDHAFGSFRQLLEAVSRSLPMGCMLTFRGSRKEDAATGRLPDENFAREVMQLFTIGLYRLNPDGTLVMRAGKPVETYRNADVAGLAKVFTGWELAGDESVPECQRRPMALHADRHSLSEKKFLGTTIPSGTGGVESLRIAMDVLNAHPNVGPFIGRQLIQRMTASNPSPAYVERVSRVFNDDGAGRRGNLGAVWRAILLDPEARQLDPDSATAGKIREPVLRFANWARAFGARSVDGKWAMPDTSDNTIRLAQSPMRAPSVFNFFRPGYAPPGTRLAARGLVAPELQITDETSVAGYLNFLSEYVDKGWHDLQTAYKEEVAIAHDVEALVGRITMLLAGDGFSRATSARIAQAVETIPPARPLDRVRTAIKLVAASPDYLVQR